MARAVSRRRGCSRPIGKGSASPVPFRGRMRGRAIALHGGESAHEHDMDYGRSPGCGGARAVVDVRRSLATDVARGDPHRREERRGHSGRRGSGRDPGHAQGGRARRPWARRGADGPRPVDRAAILGPRAAGRPGLGPRGRRQALRGGRREGRRRCLGTPGAPRRTPPRPASPWSDPGSRWSRPPRTGSRPSGSSATSSACPRPTAGGSCRPRSPSRPKSSPTGSNASP